VPVGRPPVGTPIGTPLAIAEPNSPTPAGTRTRPDLLQQHETTPTGPVGSAYGSEGWGFESLRARCADALVRGGPRFRRPPLARPGSGRLLTGLLTAPLGRSARRWSGRPRKGTGRTESPLALPSTQLK
jgi:hypothetical protein